MTSNSIYTILSSLPHNSHYLTRYSKFIESCDGSGKIKHHICPKARDMFPQYASLKTNDWNCALLTHRQHAIAHLILWKAYKNRAMTSAYKLMCDIQGLRITSKTYESIMSDTLYHGRSKEHEANLQQARLDLVHTKETKDGISKALKGTHQRIIICPHCNKSGGNAMRMHHFDNCKFKPQT